MCRTGCPTQDHVSWAACARDSGIRVAYCDSANGRDLTAQKNWDRELDAYGAARKQGIQPATTRNTTVIAAPNPKTSFQRIPSLARRLARTGVSTPAAGGWVTVAVIVPE